MLEGEKGDVDEGSGMLVGASGGLERLDCSFSDRELLRM